MSRDPRRAYAVVDAFEAELCDYTGAPFAVAVNSCTNAIFLALTWWRIDDCDGEGDDLVLFPRRTYVGVLQAALNAGHAIVDWDDEDWQGQGWCQFSTTPVIDAARSIGQGSYFRGTHMCLSFHAAKQLPLGRGGAILTDSAKAAEWFRAARMDGRPPGAPIEDTVFPGFHCPMPPDTAARGLDILSRWNDAGYSPPPLPPTDYPDLSLLMPVTA